MFALGLGTALAIGILVYVLYPVFFPPDPASWSSRPTSRWTDGRDEIERAALALRELELDRSMGKLADDDYQALRRMYEDRPVAAMESRFAVAEGTATQTAPPEDAIEAAVRAYRETHTLCPRCGPRPERDAVYCSECGTYLPARCPRCQVLVVQAGARYCADCGHRLAASARRVRGA